MRNRKTIGLGVVLAVIMFPLLAEANPDMLTISPDVFVFGDVEIGETSTIDGFLINSNGSAVTVLSIVLHDPSGVDFSATLPSTPVTLDIGEAVGFSVSYTPSSAAQLQASLLISSTDWMEPEKTVYIYGTGVEPPPSQLTIDEILAFFDDSVVEGSIQGTGPTCAAKRAHLKVFKFKLLMAAFFIAKEWDKGACQLLGHAYERSDGQKPPKDWIEDVEEGSGAVLALNNMLLLLMSDMGCL